MLSGNSCSFFPKLSCCDSICDLQSWRYNRRWIRETFFFPSQKLAFEQTFFIRMDIPRHLFCKMYGMSEKGGWIDTFQLMSSRLPHSYKWVGVFGRTTRVGACYLSAFRIGNVERLHDLRLPQMPGERHVGREMMECGRLVVNFAVRHTLHSSSLHTRVLIFFCGIHRARLSPATAIYSLRHR